MKYKFLIILTLLISLNLFAGNGIISILTNYVTVHQELLVTQDSISRSKAASDRYQKLLDLEDSYVSEIDDLLSDTEEFQQLTVNYLVSHFPDSDLLCFERFIPNDRSTLSPAMQKLQNAISSIKIRRAEHHSQLIGIVDASGLNFRKGPGTNYDVIDILSSGSRIAILGYTGNWIRAKYINKTGYVYQRYIDIEKPSEDINRYGVIISTIGANIRKGPSTKYTSISVKAYGERLFVNYAVGNWYNVLLDDNRVGYIYSSLVRLGSSSNNGSNNGNNNSNNNSNNSNSNNNNSSNNNSSSNNSNSNNNNSSNNGNGTDIPANTSSYTKIHSQRPTFYIIACEKGFSTSGIYNGVHYNGSEVKYVKTRGGSVIEKTSGRFFAELCMEGSGELLNGKHVSWAGHKRFNVLTGTCMGIAATGNPVIPFHTLAINKNEMHYNSVYYIPKTRGLKLPNGETHDGFWFAHDTGGAFTGTPRHRIDMFVGYRKNIMFMSDNGIYNMKPLEIYRVDSATKQKVYDKYKKELQNKSSRGLETILQ